MKESAITEANIDVLVVGGGLIGCATAWHLARAGAAVLLVEAGEINAGASGQNAGSLHFQIERRFIEGGDAGQAAAIVALNRLAVDDWRGLEAELGVDLHVVMAGGLMVAETAAEVALLEAKSLREAEHGLATRIVDGYEARRLAPYLATGVLAACHAPDEGHADPKAVTLAFAAAARASGTTVATRTRVTAIERRPGGYTVALDGSEGARQVRCGQVLIAAGAWTQQVAMLANVHVPLFAVALQMNVTERRPPFMPHLIQHAGRRLSMKQASLGNVLIGGGWPARLGQGFDPGLRAEVLPASLTGNLRAAADVVPEVARLNLLRTWTGVTTISGDQLPIAGEVPGMPGLFIAAGGSAFTLGPTFARLIAAAMRGQPDARLDIVSMRRFDHLNSFMGQA